MQAHVKVNIMIYPGTSNMITVKQRSIHVCIFTKGWARKVIHYTLYTDDITYRTKQQGIMVLKACVYFLV